MAPKVTFPIVDIQSVAQAHFSAATKPEVANQRFALVNQMMWMKGIADTLHQEYARYGYKPPTSELSSYCAAWMMASFQNEIKLMLPIWGIDWEV